MKDKHSKELKRPFAQGKRPKKEDMLNVRIVEEEPKIDITKEEGGRIKVTKHKKDGSDNKV